MTACRRVIGSLGLVVFGIAVATLIGEVIARLAAADSATVLRRRDHHLADLPVLRTVQDISKPNVRGVFYGTYLRTNAHGFRGPDYSPEPADGVFRIAIAGDSVTMGVGVAEEDTYAMQLERLLNGDGADRRYEVVNASLAGSNIAGVMRLLARAIQLYHPQLLIYGFTLNDIEGPSYRRTSRPSAEQPGFRYLRYNYSPSYLLRALWPRWVSLQETFWPTPGSYLGELSYNYVENAGAWDDFVSGLDQLAAFAQKRSVCGHVFIHTQLHDLSASTLKSVIYDRVEAAALARGLSVTQSFSQVMRHPVAELRLSMVDTHPNPAGHRVLARALFDGLQALPEACWRAGAERAAPRSPQR